MEKEEILEFRHKLGISQGELARLLGVCSVSVWKWETGRARPRGSSLRALITLGDMPAEKIRQFLAKQPILSK